MIRFLNKDKKLKRFYEEVVNDIKVLGNSEKENEDKENEFVRDLMTKENDNNDKEEEKYLTIDQKLKLIQLKNNTMKNLSNDTEHEHTESRKLESSLAFTEDEINERIEWAKEQLLKFFEESNDSFNTTSIPNQKLREKFCFYIKNPYLQKPFKKVLDEIAYQDDNDGWYLKISNLE